MRGDPRLYISRLSSVREVDVFIFHDVLKVKSASQSNKSKRENSRECAWRVFNSVCVCVFSSLLQFFPLFFLPHHLWTVGLCLRKASRV